MNIKDCVDGKAQLSAFVVHGGLVEITINSEVNNNTRVSNRVFMDRRGAEMLLSELKDFIERSNG